MYGLPANASEWGISAGRSFEGFSIKRFAQPPRRRLPWHEHEAASICFVVSGSYTERTRSWGSDLECGPQAMVFKPAGERHSDDFGRFGGTCLLIEIGSARLTDGAPLDTLFAQPRLLQSARLSGLGHALGREFRTQDACAALALEGLVLEILAEAARGLAAVTSRPPAWLAHAHELVRESYRDPLSLAAIAREVGMHPSHVARSYRKHFRRSIGESVRALRVERAARELVSSSASLTEIGLGLGFFDQSHFCRVFRRQTGLTPAQFRSAAQQKTRGLNGD
jgi:AraC family transcriptional regulator